MSSGTSTVALDFQVRFPHRFWLSSWGKSEEYPGGFRYKLLSSRTEPHGHLELVIVLEQPGGLKTELERLDVKPDTFERTADLYVDALAESGDVTFFAIDATRCRSAQDFQRVVTDAGWYDDKR